MISKEVIDKVENETDIVALVNEFLPLERSGKNYRGLCPFHDDNNPSFSVSPEKNIAMCMSCREGGRPIKFYRTIKNISFNQAVKELAERLGIKVDYNNDEISTNNELYEMMDDATNFYKTYLINSERGEQVLKYLKQREISNEAINFFNLGYAPSGNDELYNYLKSKQYKTSDMLDLGLINRSSNGSYYDFFRNRLIFPIKDEYNKIVGFSARSLSKNDNVKYINSPDTKLFKKTNILYNLYDAKSFIRREKSVIIFEGFFDVITAYDKDVKNTIASMGTAFTKNQIDLIKEQTNKAIISFDGDDAGKNATLSLIPNMLKERLDVEVIDLPEKIDPDDFLKRYGKEKFYSLINNSVDAYDFSYNYYLKKTNRENINDINKLINNINNMLMYSTSTTKGIFRKRLSRDLNINESEIIFKHSEVIQDYPDIRGVVKPKKVKLASKYEQAERRLIILMIRSKEWFIKIKDQIRVTDSSNITLTNIRTKLASYYDYNDDFDLLLYKDLLDQEEIDYFENIIQKDSYWQNQTHLDDVEISKYVNLLKETALIRRREYLKSLIIEKSILDKDFKIENEELKEINMKLSNHKEE